MRSAQLKPTGKRLRRSLSSTLIGCGIGALATISRAGTSFALVEDAHIQNTLGTPPIAVLDQDSSQLFAGCAGTVGRDRCSVIPFQLPDFGAVDDPFDTASFLFNYEGSQNSPVGNVDVYGLGRRAAPTVLVEDYWTATAAIDPTDATLIAQDVITENSSAFGEKSVSNTDLVDYLNAQYAGGAGAGDYVFFRLSVDAAQTGGASRYLITSADGGTATTRPRLVYNEGTPPVPTTERPFIWVRDSEKAEIQSKITNHSWAQSLRNGIVNRVAGDVASHQSNRDTFLRGLPVVWSTNPPIYKTYPSYSEARGGSEDLFNTGVDCAVLYYLTGDEKYARCAADILHNAVQTILPVNPSTSVGNGGWIIQDSSYGLLYEARIMGSQLPIIYDFLHGWLQSNQVHDVASGGMVDFDFGDAQELFRTYYELTRDHGSKGTNWSALMATCMLNCSLALDSKPERDAALQVYLTTGSNRQASLDYDYRYYTEPGSVWPESLQYASAVGEIRSLHMVMLERYDPDLSLFDAYPNLPLSIVRVRDFIYPNGTEQISFGDGKRRREEQSFFEYELIYRHAKERGYSELTSLMGSLINGGIAAGDYNRSSLKTVGSLGPHCEPLQLLWQEPTVTEAPQPHVLPRSDELPFAGITLQRNLSPNGDPNHGLMGFLGGAAHIHSHACGLAMELYGMGEVMGAKGGRGNSYNDAIHKDYYRLFSANNTIIVNGASIGDGGWKDLGIDTVDSVSMEPQPFAEAVSSNLSFLCSAFNDDRGNLAEATQQRTLALVRTSDTSGFYVDVFRSTSSVTNRTATTLDGSVTDQYHDYIYRNIGDLAMTIEADGASLPLLSQSNRFQNDVGATWGQPGWRSFSNTEVSYPGQSDLFAQFKATPSGRSSLYMDMHMPAIATREVAKTDAPPIKYAPAPYDNRDSPTLVIRQIGEAWDEPFVSVFEPHFGASGGTVRSTTALRRGDTVVGVKVESEVGGRNVVHHVISNPNDNQTYEDPASGLSFQGRFAIVADFGGGDLELYLGDGRSLAYGGTSIASLGGDTEASLVIRPGQEPVVTSNGAVEVVVAEADPGPVAHWPMDEGAGTITMDARGFSGAADLLNGAMWGSDATRGTFVEFDGSDDRIETRFSYALSDADDFTWAWWAKRTADGSGGAIMVGNRYPGGAPGENFEFIKFTPTEAQFANTDSVASIDKVDYDDVPIGGWHHYAMVKSGTSYQWYVDGVAQGAPVTRFYSESTPIPFHIGGDDDGSGTRVNEHFTGAIDDVVLYREALSPDAVVNVMNGIYLPEIVLTSLGSPVDSTDGSVWSDGRPAHGGATYVIPATGNLRGESGSSVFPSESLTVRSGGRFQVRAIEGDVTTVDKLILEGGAGFGSGEFAELAAGTGTGVTNVLDGAIIQSGTTRLTTYGGDIARRLKLLSRIDGDGTLQVIGEGAIIEDAGNRFSGSWQVGSGSSLVFSSAGAIGSANIEVQADGALEILGDWSGSATLAVADSPGTGIAIGAFNWRVGTLLLGGTGIPDGIYTAAELNALGANPVFSGPGTIVVGDYVPPMPQVLAGWDHWNSGTAPDANVTAAGISATATASAAAGSWSTTEDQSSGRGSSGDQTWGSFDGNGVAASPVTTGAGANMTALNGVTDAEITFTLTNNGPTDWELEAFHMDVVAFRPNAPRAYELEVLSGDITNGVVFTSADDAINHLGGTIPPGNDSHDEIDLDLSRLADSTLESGGSAVIRIAFSSGTGSGGGHHLFVDNVAISGVTTALTPQQAWRFEHFGTIEATGTAADSYDANFDGESNLLEFATGQNPHANTRAETTAALNGSDLEFRYTRSKAALTDGVTFQVRWSDTLAPGSWSSAGVVDVISPDDPGSGDLEERIATIPAGLGRRFVHLKITGAGNPSQTLISP